MPFLNKAVHIDDPVVLHVADQILKNPLNPFGGEIDWFGYTQPTWTSTTNPPFLSYYLAPFAALSDYSEWVMHVAMIPFLIMLGMGMVLLGRRFTDSEIWPLLFALTSPAVIVSGNLMRDVPAMGLATLGMALFVIGVDEEDRRALGFGSALVGLAALTKYSSGVLVPVMLLYPLLQRKVRLMVWIWPAVLLLALWCLHNWVVYGIPHILYLALERASEEGIGKEDKLYGAFVVMGSSIFLAPALFYRYIDRRNWVSIILAAVATYLAYRQIQIYLDGRADIEYLFWALLGALTIYLCIDVAVRNELTPLKMTWRRNGDSFFLLVWIAMPILFSIFSTPFQAVRHLLPSIPPLVILAMSYLERESKPISYLKLSSVTLRAILIFLLAVQTGIAFLAQAADSEYANVYREYSRIAQERWISDDHDTWYIGYWGWKFYMDRAGFRQMRRHEPFPQLGDIVIHPVRVHQGETLSKEPYYFDRQQLLDSVTFDGKIPARTQNFRGAGFYSVISLWGQWIPYRIGQDLDHERFDVYRIIDPRPTGQAEH